MSYKTKIFSAFTTLFCLFGCYSNIPPETCKGTIEEKIPLESEIRVERNMSQRVTHLWYVTQDSLGHWIKHGPEKTYYINGQLESTYLWINGKRHGSFEFWHYNGNLKARGHFHHGLLNGKAESWNKKGILLQSKSWNKGKLVF